MSTRTGFQADVQAVILAGGGGKRMLPLSHGTQKGLLPIASRPLIACQLDQLQKAGITQVVIVTSAAAAPAMKKLAEQRTAMDVTVEVTGAEVQGTADALRQIRPKL